MTEPVFRRYRRFFGADPKRDVDEELAFHLAMRTEEFRRAGMSKEEAEEATMQRFGNMREVRDEVENLAVKRHTRRHRAWRVDAFLQDLRFAWRTFVSNPGYSVVVVLTLALGIGANAAVFSVAYGVLFRPLPYRDADQLVRVWSRNDKLNLAMFSVSPADYLDWKTQSRAFTAMAAFERQRDATLATGDEPQTVSVTTVTPDVFALLGAPAFLGRTLLDADVAPDAPTVVVMSHALWTTQFGGDRGVVGRDVMLDGKRHAVVGVMPPRFVIPGTTAELWAPIQMSTFPTGHGFRFLRVLGRLAPGVSAASAMAQLDVIAARTALEFPADAANWSTNLMLIPEMMIGTQFRRAVIALGGVVMLVLLIACANAANLQLARAASRERELALRAALGASRGRIATQLLTESILVAIIAGVVGLALAYGGVELLRTYGETTVPRLEDVKLDAPVLAFTTIVALGSGILFGLLPALRSARADVSESLKQGGRGAGRSAIAGRVRSGLVVAEISLSLVLLIGAGLVLRSLSQLQAVDIGFEPRGVIIVRTALSQANYRTAASAAAFYRSALERTTATAGVESAALVSSAPFAGGNPGFGFVKVGEPLAPDAPAPGAAFRVISEGYFRTMGIRLLRGRDFTPADRDGAPATVIISSETAKKYWPNEDPMGRQIRVGDRNNGTVLTIVGIAADVRYQSLDADGLTPLMYTSWYDTSWQPPQRTMTVVTRARTDVAVSLRTALASIDRRLPAPAVTPIATVVATATSAERFAVTLFGVFALLALVLAAVGLYGVLAYLVRQRTHELGIRVALGAPRSRLMSMVVGGALRLTAAGVAIGLVAAYGLTRLIEKMLFGVSPTDTRTFVLLPLLLAAVSVLASLVPAMRATRADPMSALRGEV